MITFGQLLDLDRALAKTPTLTMYIDGRNENPAWRTSWRRALKQQEARLRGAMEEATHDEQEALTASMQALEHHLLQRRGALEATGWVGIVADGEVLLEGALAGSVPTHGAWGPGVAVAPYLVAPDPAEAAWVLIVDSRASRIFRADHTGVHRVAAVRTQLADSTHQGGGVRGGVGRDEAERERRAARQRMLHAVAEQVRALPRARAVFVGGTPQLIPEAMRQLEACGVAEVHEAPVLGARARVSEIARGVREGLANLRLAEDAVLVEQVEQAFADDALACLGAARTARLLEEQAVKDLLVSEHFVATQPEVAEVFVRSALAQQATVRVVAGDAARRLDDAGGTGALLRFDPFREAKAPEEALANV